MDITSAVRSPGYLKLLVIAALLGLPFGAIALAFVGAIHEGEHLVFTSLPQGLGLSGTPWWFLMLMPLVGGVLTGLFVHTLPGHGGHGPLEHSAAPVLPAYLPGIVLAALAGLSFGTVLGPEAPLIALGLGMGAWTAHRLGQGEGPTVQLISLTAVFAMISALFGGPIVAAVLIIETVGLAGSALTVAILPALLAGGTGYLAYTGLDSWTGITAPTLAVPELPPGGPIGWGAFAAAIGIGLAAGLLCVAVRRLGGALLTLSKDRHPVLVTSAVGLVVGVLAATYQGITGDPGTNLLFSGQSALPDLAEKGPTAALGALTLLLVLKAVAYALCLGGGFRGGPIFPALFLGSAIGTVAAQLVPAVSGISPLAGFAAGMAAGAAGMMRVPLSALVLVTVIVGPTEASVLPLVVVALVVALVVSTRLDGAPPATIAPDSTKTDDVPDAVSASPAASSL